MRKKRRIPVEGRQISPNKLRNIWAAYIAFKRPQVSPSTYKRDYRRMTKRILKLQKEAGHCRDAIEIWEWLMARYAPDTVRRTLEQFSACCTWAELTGRYPNNPFHSLKGQVKAHHKDPDTYRAFTFEDRALIMDTFKQQKVRFLPWVQFMFWTGCRPEEAAGLTWEHVLPDCSMINIVEAMPADTQILYKTKNYLKTEFPCNPRLKNLLLSMKRPNQQPEDRLFQSTRRPYFNYIYFQDRHWKPLVKGLFKEGKISFYGSQYHCRHTWITMALKNDMSLMNVSYLARVSTTVLLKHYADRDRSIEIPEF